MNDSGLAFFCKSCFLQKSLNKYNMKARGKTGSYFFK